MDITELMTTRLFTCEPSDSLNRAAQLMWDHNCSCVPIVDGERKLIGLVTERDVAMAAYTQGKLLAEIPVLDAMSRTLHACEARCPFEVAQNTMQSLGISRMPVIDEGGRLVGLFTKSDLFREESERAEPSAHAVQATLDETQSARTPSNQGIAAR